jgi:hypothetical protein
VSRVVPRGAGYVVWVEDDSAADDDAAEALLAFYDAAGWRCLRRGSGDLFRVAN